MLRFVLQTEVCQGCGCGSYAGDWINGPFPFMGNDQAAVHAAVLHRREGVPASHVCGYALRYLQVEVRNDDIFAPETAAVVHDPIADVHARGFETVDIEHVPERIVEQPAGFREYVAPRQAHRAAPSVLLQISQGRIHHPGVECGAYVLGYGYAVHIRGFGDVHIVLYVASPDGDVCLRGLLRASYRSEASRPPEDVEIVHEHLEGVASSLPLPEVRGRPAYRYGALAHLIEHVVRQVLPVLLVGRESYLVGQDLYLVGGVPYDVRDGRHGFGAPPVSGQDEDLLHQRILLTTPA